MRKLNDISEMLQYLSDHSIKKDTLEEILASIKEEIGKIEVTDNRGTGGFFGFGKR